MYDQWSESLLREISALAPDFYARVAKQKVPQIATYWLT